MVPHVKKVVGGEYDIAYDNPSPVILDIGANVGSFAAWASMRWPSSFIHCYEPIPDNFAFLQENLELIADRVSLNNVAIGLPHDEMYLGKNNCGECSFYPGPEQTDETIQVVVKSPEILPQADLLKLDVEGAEVEILSHLPRIEYDAIVLEYHSEENRRLIDKLLSNYILVGGNVICAHRGTLKYLKLR